MGHDISMQKIISAGLGEFFVEMEYLYIIHAQIHQSLLLLLCRHQQQRPGVVVQELGGQIVISYHHRTQSAFPGKLDQSREQFAVPQVKPVKISYAEHAFHDPPSNQVYNWNKHVTTAFGNTKQVPIPVEEDNSRPIFATLLD